MTGVSRPCTVRIVTSPRLLVIQHLVHDHLHELAPAVTEAGFDVVTWCTYLHDTPPVSIDDVDAIISLGGDERAYDEANVAFIRHERELLATALDRKVPVFGLCFGAQILAIAAGGRGFKAPRHEIGWTTVAFTPAADSDPIGRLLRGSPQVFQFHYDTFSLPEGAVVLGTTADMIQAYRVGPRAWGVQFHLEADPGLIYDWLGTYAEKIAQKGIEAATVQQDTRRYWRAYRDVSWEVAAEFCRIALQDRANQSKA